MRPGCSIEGADAAGVRIGVWIIVGDGDQAVTRPASNIRYHCAGHSGVCLIVNHPVRSVETHQAGGSSDPDSTARVRFDIKDVRAGQRRVARIIQRESAVVAGDKFSQPVFRTDPEIVLRVHAHCVNIVKAIIVTVRAERDVNPVATVQPIHTGTGAAAPNRPLPLQDRFNSNRTKLPAPMQY